MTHEAGLLAQPQHGVVSAVDPVRGTVRVTLQPDGVETGDIPTPCLAAGTLRIGLPLETGTQVLCVPVGADAEQFTVAGVLNDATMLPPVSPQTGQPAQPGELLATCGQQGAPQPSGTPQAAVQGGGWLHVTAAGLFAGAGNATIAVRQGGIVLTVGGVTATLGPGGLIVQGGDVQAGSISLEQHMHGGVQSGSANTGVAVG